ncbi:MAG: hypothetical protein R3248_00895 [Candidatus Promineifilaceae bacterium]|nr:hypothetical protein [Candidatus Promineifilaceae bacterium]
MTQFLKIANLEEESVARIRALEEELGAHVMAFTPGPDVASLPPEQVERIKALEEELGVILLVYESS